MDLPQDSNIIDKAKGFGTAMVNWAAQDKFARTTDEEFAFRRRECNACSYWVPEAFNGIGQCKLCGCTGLKLYIPSSRCPHNPPKWEAISAPDKTSSHP